MNKMQDIIRGCLQVEGNLEPREEAVWLDRKYRMFMERNGYRKKQDADRELCQRIFGIRDCGIGETQKLRYWRTGRHMPNDRGVVERLGIAMEMEPDEQAYLMKGWFDRCDRCFSIEETEDTLYVSRQGLMRKLVNEYLLKCRGRETDYITREKAECNFRHYYYMDSLMCVSGGAGRYISIDSHYQSVYYQSELSRNVRLLGEIPRNTMIRHLILLMNPFVSRVLLDERLEAFGYLPLMENHSMVTGERLDLVLIRILTVYETVCRNRGPEECRSWLESALAETDRLLAESGQNRMRFMNYKGLRLEEREGG